MCQGRCATMPPRVRSAMPRPLPTYFASGPTPYIPFLIQLKLPCPFPPLPELHATRANPRPTRASCAPHQRAPLKGAQPSTTNHSAPAYPRSSAPTPPQTHTCRPQLRRMPPPTCARALKALSRTVPTTSSALPPPGSVTGERVSEVLTAEGTTRRGRDTDSSDSSPVGRRT